MKKTLKGILNSLTLIAMVLVIALSVITFVGVSKNTPTSSGTKSEQVSNPGGTNTGNPSNPEPENPTPAETFELSGIYQFDRELSFDDIYYKDETELINYFKTKDLNGVYNAVKPLGFDKFIMDMVKHNDNFVAYYFNEGKAQPMETQNGTFSFLSSKYEDYEDVDFDYTIGEDGTITTSVPVLNLEFNSKTNELVMVAQFYYTDENDNDVLTPLYVKATLSSVEDSTKLFGNGEYSYVAASATVETTSNMNVDINSKLDTLMTMLNIEPVEGKTARELIESVFAGRKLHLNDDASRIVFVDENGDFSITPVNTETKTFTWNNANVKMTSRKLNLEKNKFVVVFEIEVDEESKLVFEFEAENK